MFIDIIYNLVINSKIDNSYAGGRLDNLVS